MHPLSSLFVTSRMRMGRPQCTPNNKCVVYNSQFMQTRSKHLWVWNTSTSPWADHLCKPNNKCVVYNSPFMQTGKNASKKWCETHHRPRQSRSEAGSIYRCESRRKHPGQGQQSRHGPQHGLCKTKQCGNGKLSSSWKATYRPQKRMQNQRM